MAPWLGSVRCKKPTVPRTIPSLPSSLLPIPSLSSLPISPSLLHTTTPREPAVRQTLPRPSVSSPSSLRRCGGPPPPWCPADAAAIGAGSGRPWPVRCRIREGAAGSKEFAARSVRRGRRRRRDEAGAADKEMLAHARVPPAARRGRRPGLLVFFSCVSSNFCFLM